MKVPDMLNISRADYIEGYKILLTFDNPATRLVDFEPFLRHTRNPMTTKYLRLSNFKTFKIVYGNLDWNGLEMCFPIADLYTGNILKMTTHAE
jgi:hypothetical protein